MPERLTCPNGAHGERDIKEWRCIKRGVPIHGGGTADVWLHQRWQCRAWAIVVHPAVDREGGAGAMMPAFGAVR